MPQVYGIKDSIGSRPLSFSFIVLRSRIAAWYDVHLLVSHSFETWKSYFEIAVRYRTDG